MNLFGILAIFLGIIDRLIPLAIAVAVLYFLWGAKTYITASDGEAQNEGRSMIVHGLVVLFVMVSFWGLVNIIIISLGVGPMNLGTQNINIGGSGGSGLGGGRDLFRWCVGRNCN